MVKLQLVTEAEQPKLHRFYVNFSCTLVGRPLTLAKPVEDESNKSLYNVNVPFEKYPEEIESTMKHVTRNSIQTLTRKSTHILRLLSEHGDRRTVYSFYTNQTELAHKLHITRQALSVHFKRLRESGFVQIGRGFVNVTEDGLKAIGRNLNPVIVTLRLSPQNRLEAFAKVRDLPAIEIFRVTGDWDVVLVVAQDDLDEVMQVLDGVEGVLETRSFVSIETM
jgi:DNA-binding Lrp family transcriptional regulator